MTPSTQQLVKFLTLSVLFVTLLLPIRTAATSKSTLVRQKLQVPSSSELDCIRHDALDYNERNLETTSTMWWEDDVSGTDDDDGIAGHNIQGKQIHKWFLPWWKSRRQQQQIARKSKEQSVLQNRMQNVPQPHPLRTDLYEIHCRWRGIAIQQQPHHGHKRRGRRALWTSRLAVKDDSDCVDRSLISCSIQRRSGGLKIDYGRKDDEHHHFVKTIYDDTTFQLEFDPTGYVRLFRRPQQLQDSHLRNSRYHNRSSSVDIFDTDDCNTSIGTWKLQPEGLIVHIPLPTLYKSANEQRQQQRQQHIMEMDFHMNPFGVQPKLTRGLIFLPTDNKYGNPLMKLLRIRPIVGTFTGKGIGIDTVDLSYQKRT